MLVNQNMFEGIRLYGDDEIIFVDETWDEAPQGSWSDV